ncbi:hypothetical protein GCM10020000_41680 [Streptomyces olivoverticillatus]
MADGAASAAPTPCTKRPASSVYAPGGERRGGGGDPEDRDPDHQQPAPPQQVGHPAAQQQQTAEAEPVGGADQGQLGARQPQVMLDRRERGRQHRDAEDQYDLDCAQEGETAPGGHRALPLYSTCVRMAYGSWIDCACRKTFFGSHWALTVWSLR